MFDECISGVSTHVILILEKCPAICAKKCSFHELPLQINQNAAANTQQTWILIHNTPFKNIFLCLYVNSVERKFISWLFIYFVKPSRWIYIVYTHNTKTDWMAKSTETQPKEHKQKLFFLLKLYSFFCFLIVVVVESFEFSVLVKSK